MRESLFLLFVLLLTAAAAPAAAQSVYEKGGRIYFAGASGRVTELTSSGMDSEPGLSPDKRVVAFVRATPGRTVNTGAGDVEAKEIWLVDAGGGRPRLLVQAAADDDPKRVLAGFSAPQFSPDGARVYFLSSAYATSDAVHAVEVGTGRTSFISDGNSLEVIGSGRYGGHLLVSRHTYDARSSRDDYWLLSPGGRIVRRVGGEAAYTRFKRLHVEPARR